MEKRFFNVLKSIVIIGVLSSCQPDEFLDDGDVRDEFVGEWAVDETGTYSGAKNYILQIEKNVSNSTRVNIWNLYKLGYTDSIYASVSTVQSNTLTIPVQTLLGHTVNGVGNISNDQINLTYYVNDGNAIDTLNAILSR